MVDRARLLMDRLLGRSRDDYGSQSMSEMCIFSIAGLCPYKTFRNTKMDLGECKYKIHNGRDSKLCTMEYETELFIFCVEIYKYIRKLIDQPIDKSDEIVLKERLIDTALQKIRDVGLNENIEKALLLYENLKIDIEELDRIKESYYVNNKDKSMARCQVCGITVITNYGSPKYMTHINGKLHNGVRLIYDKLGELINKFGEEELLKIANNKEFKYLKKF